MFNQDRVKKINNVEKESGPVVYWMSRDQRVKDNWALIYARNMAIKYNSPLFVIFNLVPDFLNAGLRQYDFMLRGLMEVESNLKEKNILFFLLSGQPKEQINKFINKHNISCLVADFDPLKIKRQWKRGIAKNLDIPFYEVDAHNIIPCRVTSPKQEYAAYTIRPKIKKLLSFYLTDYPEFERHAYSTSDQPKIDWESIYESLVIDNSVKPVEWIKPGEKAAQDVLDKFIGTKLINYSEDRNNPNKNATSDLSLYLHFGQISAQRIALEVEKSTASEENKSAFLEELIIRRELSDNFCFYNKYYDSFEGFPDWAKKTLNEHRSDKRDYSYSQEEFEFAKTHDNLWNAAQMQMIKVGKMHGYMRMYWAKKILEWTKTPEKAMKIAIYLNDKYELDGRDPNGYAGVAWSIGGVHDRAWAERPVFGKIRYMSYKGCKSKFDVDEYINQWLG